MPDAVLESTAPASNLEDAPCVSCGAGLVGPYCHACGERRLGLEDESLRHFLREQFHEVTSADGRLWRTVKALFVPGKLTEEYISGRRRLYVRPVRIFLIVNVLFFLWVGVFGGQGFVGDASLYRSNARFVDRMTEAATAAGVEDGVFNDAFSARARTLAPTLIAVFIPGLMLVLTLVLAPARSRLVRHAVFATHFVAVLMATTILISLVLALPLFVVKAATGRVLYNLNDSILLPVFLVFWSTYLVIGIRRVYIVPWWGAVASGLTVATIGTLVSLEIYRTILFYVTVWTVDMPA